MSSLGFLNQDPLGLAKGALSLVALRDQIQGGRRAMQIRDQEIARQDETRRLAGLALSGADPFAIQKLRQFNPDAALQLERAQEQAIQSQQQTQQNQNALNDKQYADARRVAEEGTRLFNQLQDNPEQWPQIREYGIKAGILPQDTPEDPPDSEATKGFAETLKRISAVTSTPAIFKATSAFGKLIQDGVQSGAISAEDGQASLEQYIQNKIKDAGADKSPKISVNVGLDKSSQSKANKEIIDARTMSDQLDKVKSYAADFDNLLGLGNSLKISAIRNTRNVEDTLNAFGIPVNAVPQAYKELSGKKAAFDTDVAQYIDSVRRAVTGAAAGEKELARIESKLKSSQTKEDFTANLAALQDIGQRYIGIREKVLRENSTLADDKKELKAAIDREIVADTKASFNSRVEELINSGVGVDQAISQVTKEFEGRF